MVNFTLYKIGQSLALNLPLKVAYKLAVFISDIHYIFADKDREGVTANLKAIFPEKSGHEIRKIRIKMFRNFAKYLVDFFRFSKIDREYIKNNVKMKGIHYLDEALAKGKGVIMLTAHIGNFELGAAVMGILGYDFWVVALPHKSKNVDDFFNSQRENKGVKVIPFGNAVKQSMAVLSKNGLLALAADRDFSREGGVLADFFGRPTYLPRGPSVFALKTGAAVVPGFMLRNADDSFTLELGRPIEVTEVKHGKLFDEDLKSLTEKYNAILESYIRKYPEQWYVFRRFWAQ